MVEAAVAFATVAKRLQQLPWPWWR